MAAVNNLADVIGGHIWVGLLCVSGGLFHILTRPFAWAQRILIYSGEAYLSYSIGAVAYMGALAAYFVSVNNTVYPEVFYGPLGTLTSQVSTEALPTAIGVVSARGWLATFHFVLAGLFLAGHIWHAIRVRGDAAGFDFKQGGMVRSAAEVQAGNLATPINASDFTLTFLKNLPIYRSGLSPLTRGLEIGMAHGYWLLGPFVKLGPLRDSESAPLAGLIAAASLIVIATVCLSLYGSVTFERRLETLPRPAFAETVPNVPTSLQTVDGWSQFSSGFLIGGVGGAFFAYLLLNNLNLFSQLG
jgi:photosystem II CP43 chlorophyll apoprotein